jgi:hypothetical protein
VWDGGSSQGRLEEVEPMRDDESVWRMSLMLFSWRGGGGANMLRSRGTAFMNDPWYSGGKWDTEFGRGTQNLEEECPAYFLITVGTQHQKPTLGKQRGY